MRRSYVITGLFLALLVSFPSCKKSGAYTDPKRELTPDYLASTEWGQETDMGINITFAKDGTYGGLMGHEQFAENLKGTWKIAGGRLNLVSDQGTPFLTGGTLALDTNSLHFRHCLKFDNGNRLWDKNSFVPEGQKALIQGVTVVSMKFAGATTTEDVKLRAAPDASAKELPYVKTDFVNPADGYGPPDPVNKTIPFVPKGTWVTVLGRTENKVKVQKWENYWYLVEVSERDQGLRMKTGWMFAEFIKLNK